MRFFRVWTLYKRVIFAAASLELYKHREVEVGSSSASALSNGSKNRVRGSNPALGKREISIGECLDKALYSPIQLLGFIRYATRNF